MLSDKNIPSALNVTLDRDLVDSCQPGDCVTIWYVNGYINYTSCNLSILSSIRLTTVERLNAVGHHFNMKGAVKQ